jgi:hypothetical protein
VWSIDTILYYATHREYGEPWAGRWSAVEVRVLFVVALWGSRCSFIPWIHYADYWFWLHGVWVGDVLRRVEIQVPDVPSTPTETAKCHGLR